METRLTTDQKIPGSTPGRLEFFAFCILFFFFFSFLHTLSSFIIIDIMLLLTVDVPDLLIADVK